MNDGWIEWIWSEEKPYPETLYDMVEVRFKDGEEIDGYLVEFWYGGGEDGYSNWTEDVECNASITHYKLVEGN